MTGRLMSALFLLAILALGGCQNPGRFQVPSSFLEPSDKLAMQVVFARHRTNIYRWLPGFDACASDGLPAFVQLDRPTVSAIAAPRSPMGLSCPVVESRAV